MKSIKTLLLTLALSLGLMGGTAQALDDIIASSVTLVPQCGVPRIAIDVIINTPVSNAGSVTFDVQIKRDAVVLFTLTRTQAPGTGSGFRVSDAPVPVGSVTYTATVDPANAVAESDETNNVASAVLPAGTCLPTDDIALTSVVLIPQCTLGQIAIDTTTFAPVANVGPVTYGVTVDVGGTPLSTYTVTSLVAGASDLTRIILSPVPVGSVTITSTVDPLGVLPELDETNNIGASVLAAGTCAANLQLFVSDAKVVLKGLTIAPGDPADDVADAIVKLNTVVNDAFYVDVDHLTVNSGKIWYNFVRQAVSHLVSAIKDLDPTADAALINSLNAVIDDQLVEAARLAAQTFLDDAIALPGDAGKITKATDDIADAVTLAAADNDARAVGEYSKSWKNSKKAQSL